MPTGPDHGAETTMVLITAFVDNGDEDEVEAMTLERCRC